MNAQLQDTKSVICSEAKSDWKFLLQPGIFKAVLIGAAIAILGQFMGVNAVLYYGPSISRRPVCRAVTPCSARCWWA